MTNSEERIERRKHKRFKGPKDVFVGIGPHFAKVGRLRDLSMDGLAFRYVGNSKPSSGSYADIFMLEGDLFLARLPIRIVSDVEIVEKAHSSFVTTRRCCVKFRKLTPRQKTELEMFMED
jgi:c-di-GMP-binding flagellar brake protein YcgR